MHNFLLTFTVIVFGVISLTMSSNLSTQSRTSQYLKEDLEIAVHDASLQLDDQKLAEGSIVFDQNTAKSVFQDSLELNSGLSASEYDLVEFQVFDHSNTIFPVNFTSSKVNFNDTFIYPTILAIVKTSTDKYFYTSQEKSTIRATSYTYKIEEEIFQNPITSGLPNENGFFWVVPYSNNITSHFSSHREDPITHEIKPHKGLDISDANILNKNVVAALGGTISYSGSMGNYGKMVEIKHGNGLVTRYAHLNSTLVDSGQTVSGGEVIGLIGSTGNSTGPHLHFETIYNGRHVNPLSFY